MKQKLMLCTILTTLILCGCGSTDSQEAKLTQEDAQSIALSHAGLTTEQVHFITSELDLDDGKRYYDVEFYTTNGQEYDYEIDSATGEIIEYDYDVEDFTKKSMY